MALGGESLEGGLGGEHAGFDCGVATFDPRGVEETGIVADQRAAGEDQPGWLCKPPAVMARAP